MKAIWKGTVVAESADTVVVEGNHYFPLASLERQYVVDSDHQTTCSWKGVASYYTLRVDGADNVNAAWYYATPKAGAESVAGRVAFWKGVQIER